MQVLSWGGWGQSSQAALSLLTEADQPLCTQQHLEAFWSLPEMGSGSLKMITSLSSQIQDVNPEVGAPSLQMRQDTCGILSPRE